MKRKRQIEKTVKSVMLKADELLQLTIAIEGPIGYEISNDYRLSVDKDGRLMIEKMTPGGWRDLTFTARKSSSERKGMRGVHSVNYLLSSTIHTSMPDSERICKPSRL